MIISMSKLDTISTIASWLAGFLSLFTSDIPYGWMHEGLFCSVPAKRNEELVRVG